MHSDWFGMGEYKCVDIVFLNFDGRICEISLSDCNAAYALRSAPDEMSNFDIIESMHVGRVIDRHCTVVLCIGTCIGHLL